MTRSLYLGQFTDENAGRVLEALDDAGIAAWTKSSGALARTLFAADWGVRIFVAEEDAERAREVARDVAPGGLA